MTLEATTTQPRTTFVYDEWMAGLGVPIHRGYAVSDLRTVELGWWEERKCLTGFGQLMGQEGVSETRVTEIPPGGVLEPYKVGVDEAVYVLRGNGMTEVWDSNGWKQSFEWSPRALFLVPANTTRQFRNLGGDAPVRVVHYSYLPLALSVVTDPGFYLNNPFERPAGLGAEDVYSEAR